VNLNEHQAKKLLQDIGVRIPAGAICENAVALEAQVETAVSPPWVVKAQIPAGGRAKGRFLHGGAQRGGIRFAATAEELQRQVDSMLGAVLVTEQTGGRGARVQSVYVESRVEVQHEHYLALTIDPESGGIVLVASRFGGTDIESTARKTPAKVHRFPLKLTPPYSDFAPVLDVLDLSEAQRQELLAVLPAMVAAFIEKDMLLLEINPYAIDGQGKLVALDASIVFDDNALFRQGHEEQMVAYDHLPDQEYAAMVQGLNYVKLPGNIATLSAGAGLAMATMDAIHAAGGVPANFLDVPPSTSVEHVRNALLLLLRDADARCLLVNVFGGGIMRCDAIADAILLTAATDKLPLPVVVRLAGTNDRLGRQRLRASLPDVYVTADLAGAVAKTVELAGRAALPSTDRPRQTWWRKVRRMLPDTVA